MTEPNLSRALDISHLKTNGSHYVVVGLAIPYRVDLPDDHYEVKIDIREQPVVVQIHIEQVEQTVETSPGTVSSFQQILQTTAMHVFIPVRVTDSDLAVTRDQLWSAIHDEGMDYWVAAISAVNRLLQIYRLYSGECTIRPLAEPTNANMALLFNQNPPESQTSVFTATAQQWRVELPIPFQTVLPDSVVETIKYGLMSGWVIPVHEELLLNAHDFRVTGNYRLAVLEAETAFEAALVNHILTQYRDNQHKSVKLKNTSHNSFTQFIDHPFTQAIFVKQFKDFKTGSALYSEWQQKVWGIRGAIVHGRDAATSATDAIEAITTVERCLQYLIDRKPTEVDKYKRYRMSFT